MTDSATKTALLRANRKNNVAIAAPEWWVAIREEGGQALAIVLA